MITTPSEKSQEAMNAKTLRVPPATLGDDLPSGGTEGQVLTMGSAGPEWDDIPEELPEGGTQGQVLTKGSEGVEWSDPATQAPYVIPVLSVLYSGAAVTLPSDTTELLISSDLTVSETQNFTQFGRDIIKDMANFKRIPVLLNIVGIDANNALESVNCSFVMKDVNFFSEVSYIFSGIVGQNISSSPYAQPKLYNIRVVCIENEGTWTCASVKIRAIKGSIPELPTGGTQGQVLTMGASAPEWGTAGGSYTDQYGLPSNIPTIDITFNLAADATITPGTVLTPSGMVLASIANANALRDYMRANNIGDPGIAVTVNCSITVKQSSVEKFRAQNIMCLAQVYKSSGTTYIYIRGTMLNTDNNELFGFYFGLLNYSGSTGWNVVGASGARILPIIVQTT